MSRRLPQERQPRRSQRRRLLPIGWHAPSALQFRGLPLIALDEREDSRPEVFDCADQDRKDW